MPPSPVATRDLGFDTGSEFEEYTDEEDLLADEAAEAAADEAMGDEIVFAPAPQASGSGSGSGSGQVSRHVTRTTSPN